jgi:outer membrane lipoprotein-sorting protein
MIRPEYTPRLWLIASSVLGVSLLTAGESQPSAQELARKSYLAQFYAGKDQKARVTMRLISKDGKERLREITMLRRNITDGGNQKYFIHFRQPSDVEDMTFLIFKYPGKDDDRWLFIPAVRLVKRIAASDKRSSFVGSDFTYEDVSGRDLEDDSFALLPGIELDGKAVYVLENTPRDAKSANYARKVSFIDRVSFIPLKEEYYDARGKLLRLYTTDELRQIPPASGKGDGYWTIIKRTMKDLTSGHRTEVTLTKVEYDLGLPDDIFTERYLRTPPQKYLN